LRLRALAGIASHYEMPGLSTLLFTILPLRITLQNALFISKGMVAANLTEYVDRVLPFIVAHFQQFPQPHLFQCITPRVLGPILWHPKFPADITADSNFRIIDSLCKQKGALSEDDCELLSSAITLTGDIPPRCMLEFQCDWLPF
jgi:hypothetical protein